uniref:EF-hand domain-containing protein n=1 Tax=viral metagenome TaxID=1070528 RepID=A0A6C0KHK7_9ZZZZ
MLHKFNENIYFITLVSLILSIGSRFVNIQMPETLRRMGSHTIAEHIMIFAGIFLILRNINLSIIITIVFLTIINFLREKEVKENHLIKWSKIQNMYDKNQNNIAEYDEIEEAIRFLEKTKQEILLNGNMKVLPSPV